MTTTSDYLKKIRFRREWGGIIIVAFAFIVLVYPLGLPMTIGPLTKDYYNTIESLAGGSVVEFSTEQALSGYVGRRDVLRATIYHLAQKKAKLLFHSYGEQTPLIWEAMRKYTNFEAMYGYKYGEDFVIFPFLAGQEIALATVAADMYSIPTDIYGTPTGNIPMMKNIRTAHDVDLIIEIGGWNWAEFVVRQWPAKYGMKMIDMSYYAYIAAYYGKYVFGVLDLTCGGAEYELLTGYKGEEIAKMDIMNLGSLFVMVLIVWGTIEYIVGRTGKSTIKEPLGDKK